MSKNIDISTISDWDELEDFEKSDLIASILKSGANVTGLPQKEIIELSRLGGYPYLPDMPKPQVKMETDYKTPMAVQLGSSFIGGAIPGGKAGAALGSSLGPWGTAGGAVLGGLAGGALSAGLDYEISKRTNSIPEGGSAKNLINALSGAIPGGAGVVKGMARAGVEGALGTALDNLSGTKYDQVNPLASGVKSAIGSGLANSLTKPFGERARKVANEKDLTDWLRARMGNGSTIQVGKQAQELLDANQPMNASIQQTGFNPVLSEAAQKFNELRERTGLDPLKFTKEDRKVLEGFANRTNDEVFGEILSPIFKATSTDELPKAAESVRKGIDSLAKASGKSREEFAKGLRKNFVQSVLGDDDIMNRPDSFRFRLEALGPDVVNELFSSSGRKGERSGAYHALLNLAEAASKEGGHFKVLLSPNGVTVLEHMPFGVGKMAEKFLPKGSKSYQLDTDNKFELAQRSGEMLGIGAAALNDPMTALAVGGVVGGREALRGAHFTWEKAIEKFAARSNRASDILRILASGEQRFSRPMINNFMNSLAKDADEKIGW